LQLSVKIAPAAQVSRPTADAALEPAKGFAMDTSRSRTAAALVILTPILTFALGLASCEGPSSTPLAVPSSSPTREYLFCHWNLENFFDDKDDHRTQPGDREYDQWFANNPKILEEKLAHLASIILMLNDGNGPDILGIVEVESIRAAELLQEALNLRLRDPALHYTHLLMKEVSAGRHIAPAILTRLPVQGDRTRLHGKRQRILEGHLLVDGMELVVIETHWTSRLRKDSEQHRDDYADKIYGAFKAMYKRNPQVDVLVAGDFNDTPDNVSLTRDLHATANADLVRAGGDEPAFLNLFADKDPARFGTLYYRRWFIFDQILVSPGMLDRQGWSCDPTSVRTINNVCRPGDKRPWRFGSEHDRAPRGYSDHFPVVVHLQVHAP
jgi:endonuclease/exonuclease/phosphatase family metal-dependent hydrolase